MKVVIDTDPGLDDAVAILFALTEPAFDVRSITTVAGNIGLDRTTDNAARLVAVTGARVAVAAGAARPMARDGIDEEAIHGADGLGGVSLPEPLAPPRNDGLETLAALLSTAEAGSLTALALGPLTNFGILARDYPDAFGRLGGIIAMGGAIYEVGNAGPRAEFNMAADPEAADIVFGAEVPLTLIPLDVTRQVRARREDLAALPATPAGTAAAALIGAYFAGSGEESRPLHDPCVMLLARVPDLFGYREMRLRVDTDEHPGRLIADDRRPPVRVAMSVDAPAALALLWQGLSRRGRS
jgi:inosine-uridine nucleoside N-ribohydrolase